MNNCTVCNDNFRNDNPNKVICDGNCRQSFHAECVNFSKNALLCYREMPNLQWFCDGCIMQTRASNVSSRPFNKVNSTVIIPTSSPSYVRRPFNAAKRKQSRNPFPNAISKNSSTSRRSVLLVSKSPVGNGVNDYVNVSRSPISKNEIPLTTESINSHAENRPHSFTTTEISQDGVAKHKPKNNSADFKEMTETSDLENPSAIFTSFAEVLNSTSMAENGSANVKNSPTKPSSSSSVHSQTITSPFKTRKDAYVSKFDPSVTEEDVVDYLLEKNVISSPKDVSCKMLVSPNESLTFLSFVSFRITVSLEVFEKLINDELWPDGVTAREFVKR